MDAARVVRSLLISLRKADDLLQVEFREFIGKYFQFLKADDSSLIHRAHRLRMRFDKEPSVGISLRKVAPMRSWMGGASLMGLTRSLTTSNTRFTG